MEIFYDYIFWFIVAALVFHLLEEQLGGWLSWTQNQLNIQLTNGQFYYIQGFALIILILFAIFGWMIPVFSLAGASTLFIDALFFHLILSIRKKSLVPGTITAVILFFPLSLFSYFAALKGGVPIKEMLISFAIGFIVASYPIVMLSLNKKTTLKI